jgi:flagellar biosynthesis protein FlhG
VSNRHQAQDLLTPAPWIAVSGGKGGVGKTLIAVNLAILTGRSGYRTLLVDLDPGLPNVDVHLRMAPRFTIEDVVDGACDMSQALIRGPGRISVLCGRSGSTRLAEGDGAYLQRVFETVQHAASGFDVVILDTGAGIGPSVLAAAQRAALVLAVTTPEPAAVTDTYALCKLLLMRKGTVPRVVINQVRSRGEAMQTGGRLSAVCQKFLGKELEVAGWLRREKSLQLSVADQRPYGITGAGPAMEDLRAMVAMTLSALPNLRRRRSQAALAPARHDESS